MAVNTKAVKTRINTVKNTKKITKAMEMVAAAKMRKAVQAAVNTRSYAALANELMNDLSGASNIEHPLAEKRKVKNILLVMITSNRGLCGSFNTSVLAKSKDFLTKKDEFFNSESDENNIDVLAIGKHGAKFAKKNKLNLVSLFDQLGENINFEEVLSVSKTITNLFEEKKYDKVFLVYTDYISGLQQEVRIRQLLPLSGKEITEMLQEAGDAQTRDDARQVDVHKVQRTNYKFEPEKESVLNFVIPRLIEIQVYQAILESAASEHSSRMIAMKNANESASEMIDSLTLEFNKARQAAITQEISEIVGGANAL